MADRQLSAEDYSVFAVMLLVSTAIGVYYSVFGGKQKTTREYLLGDKSMRSWTVAISLMASYLSAVSLLGIPAEIYTYGAEFVVLVLFAYFLVMAIVNTFYLPMFHRLQVNCVNEYLEMRFSPGTRVLGCVLFIVTYLLYLSLVLYAPALAMEAVAGIPVAASIIAAGAVCTLYTSLGGLKAVVWTDVFQSVVMVAGIITVSIVGSLHVGGIGEVWKINKARDRLNVFDFNPDPTVRNTFWTLVVGGAITTLPEWTVGQTAVQRFLAVRTARLARRAVWLNIPFLVVVGLLCCLNGLVIYAVYADCDLRTDNKIISNDQVMPFFVIDKLGQARGVPGLFTACLFAGALSTVSSGLNAVCLVVLEDIVKKKATKLTDFQAAKLCKCVAAVFGCLVISGAFVMQQAGSLVLQLAYSIYGILGGPLLGMFTLGMFVPWSNSKGVFSGVLSGIGMTLWIFIGAQVYPPDKHPAPVSVLKCSWFNSTNDTGMRSQTRTDYHDPIARLYSVSYMWYCAIGLSVTILVGCVISAASASRGPKNKEVDPKLLFPLKSWVMSFHPDHWKDWDRETGLPVRSDKEDWVQLDVNQPLRTNTNTSLNRADSVV